MCIRFVLFGFCLFVFWLVSCLRLRVLFLFVWIVWIVLLFMLLVGCFVCWNLHSLIVICLFIVLFWVICCDLNGGVLAFIVFYVWFIWLVCDTCNLLINFVCCLSEFGLFELLCLWFIVFLAVVGLVTLLGFECWGCLGLI